MQTLKYLFDSKLLLFVRNAEYLGPRFPPIEAQVWFWIYLCLRALLDSWTLHKDLFDNVNLILKHFPFVSMKRTDAYIVDVYACKL